MSGSFHEELQREEVKPPSERSTGIVFTVLAAIIAALYRNTMPVAVAFAGLSVVLGLLSWRCPQILKPLNILWFKLGMLMHRIVNPVVMLAMFAIAIVPTGLVMQRLRDPLVKRRKPAGESYWVAITPASNPASSMRQQF
jgi:energy-converting hydrogenase Eha subunit A